MQPILSIVLPTFESTHGLDILVDQIRSSKIDNRKLEIIVSDDSNSNLIKNFCLHVDFIKYIKHTNTGNPVDNWNFGIQNAKGMYIQLLHHDEWYQDKSQITELIILLEKELPGIVLLKCVTIKYYRSAFIPNWCKKILLSKVKEILHFKNFIGSPSTVVFKNDKNFFNNKYVYLVDVQFYLLIFNKYSSLKCLVTNIKIDSDLNLFLNGSITSSLLDNLKKINNKECKLLIKEFKLSKKFILKNRIILYLSRALGYVSS